MKKKLNYFFQHCFQGQETVNTGEIHELVNEIEKEYQAWFLASVIEEIENILVIDHRLPLRDILKIAAEQIVKELAAGAATIRVFDSESLRMISFGASGMSDQDMKASLEMRNSISGRVAQERRAISVSNILKDPLYKDKALASKQGFYSLLAAPLIMPTPMPSGNTVLGTLQIYYADQDKVFDQLEIIHAELLASRISFVLAKKKIYDLQELNLRKETIVNKIFVKLSRRENIKLKDLFVLLIPELQELLDIKSCSLFTVSDDQKYINLETAYPQDDCYFELGHTFTVANHPFFQAAVAETEEIGDRPHERISQTYILIKNPSESNLVSKDLSVFIAERHIHSILLVPLSVDGQVRHLLAFYATDQKEFFSDDEIELLIFFGKEIIKATRLELMSDVLHDIRNPAIAVAGFANRALKLLQDGDSTAAWGKMVSYLDIIATESARMQDLALFIGGEGREEELDLSDIARQRWHIIKEVVQDPQLRHVQMIEPECEMDLLVFCPRFGLERIIDNLFGNAARAVPPSGGQLSFRCYQRDEKAFFCVENTGEIPSYQLEKMKKGEVRGRGLNIINRFVHANHGAMKIEVKEGVTRFIVSFPLQIR